MGIMYSSMGESIQVGAKIKDLTKREKVHLFHLLLGDLGIAKRFDEEDDATARAQEIISEQYAKFCNKAPVLTPVFLAKEDHDGEGN